MDADIYGPSIPTMLNLTHVDQQTTEFIRRGMPPAAARDAARRAIGNIAYHKEEARDTRGTRAKRACS